MHVYLARYCTYATSIGAVLLPAGTYYYPTETGFPDPGYNSEYQRLCAQKVDDFSSLPDFSYQFTVTFFKLVFLTGCHLSDVA